LITYCTNIHPGEAWDTVFAALQQHIPAVKCAVSPGQAFPIGLRLSNRAAAELTVEKSMIFREWLAQNDCFVPTINGFPYGSFHGDSIKYQVYLPDWRSSERTAYTIRLANLLANLLPENVTGTISTVPIGFKSNIGSDDMEEIRRQLESALCHLRGIFEKTGKHIILSLEPEPGCMLETVDDVSRFFELFTFPESLSRHIGICYDCCHQAVEFEEPAASWNHVVSKGIRIAKVQISSAIRIAGKDAGKLKLLDEPGYLHQVVVRGRNGELDRYSDIPEAFANHGMQPGEEWRSHFHVPIYLEEACTMGTTRQFLIDLLLRLPGDVLLEVETYTWDVLPPELRSGSVTDSIIREILWLKEQLHA